MKYFKYINHKTGFTLLLAVLITSIILSISVGISVFIIRELSISSVGRESQKAFFAADSGVECALYWDLKQNSFATTSPPHNINCVNPNPITVNIGCPGSSPPCGISEFDLTFDNGACAHVKVNKTVPSSTTIDSAGRNIGDASCNSTDSNRVERALRVSY